ncbi:hypothetical protein COW36_14410 [bacterium (Candidatus Blackallbacteria) CG17_big_fil_post_rev_8_21_14_2_50_48_46]|uniref:Uncharacterized protein n=1 Tax=bacterium (Candidatus Blackallbacteria) CG17_big_fil_post_rev_8_21_14_2_50_48_46 TaxID=2014261 RepID=A0A2M7G2U9_9BACT|nr:MAG: hypothetical protein COW64_08935 [bacterium (Candidatus Blackallbacteria) CG18_big_fil_WC_8_21_14_2_50_49_26]PIW16153.1 MAG: hypothetical protein COW36_14410 [bacterium (Candidatus Blackallbacteria) CG17_big_fil_post_rev_8_21_14_2_50_48_46]PIW44240.1 MAG: hypothetical protein COW20_24740 [bacterium (Candidatus Blackallbacteria) CG13_big_fil_rev_8_21_14_2_50_49_14]
MPEDSKKDPKINNKYIVGGVALFLGIVILSQFYFRQLSPESREFHRFIEQMPLEKIQEIRIEPYTVLSLTDHTLVIRDKQQIAEIASALRQAPAIGLNHPEANWVAILRIIADREYGGQIESTRNQGVVMLYASNVRGGWNYGSYRADSLGPLLEKLAKTN